MLPQAMDEFADILGFLVDAGTAGYIVYRGVSLGAS
jgi:hypothetical protein